MDKRGAVLDIETNDLLADLLDYSSFPYKLKKEARLWTVVVTCIDTGEQWSAEKDDITKEWLKDVLEPFYYIVAHNGVKFDFPVMMLFDVFDYRVGYLDEEDTLFGKEVRILDTLILSRLGNPDRFGGHSLAAWGRRLGEHKDEYRKQCIEAGYIKASDPDGAEFWEWNPLMLPYCKQDCNVNVLIFKSLVSEFTGHNWGESIKMEHKLADLGIRRECLGFDFDKELAIQCVEDLGQKMQEIADKVEPLLPPKPLNKSELSFWTPPKTQIKKDGTMAKHMVNFLDRIGAVITDSGFKFEGQSFEIPYNEPLKQHLKAEMKDLDHIKGYLIELGWDPMEWSERDMTKDSKKKNLSFEKRVEVLDRWWKETTEGKYKKHRLEEAYETCRMSGNEDEEDLYTALKEKLKEKWPVRVYTAPKIRVGVEKDLCPNLIKLGEKVAFAKDFADWLTYRHRKNSIAGGDINDIDLEDDKPSSGFLQQYREVDGRIPTPAIEIGAVTNRYTHIGVANIARPSSMYGKEMRSLFRAGNGAVFFGFDYSSLEARVMAHYVHKYAGGVELGKAFLAEKPNDWHSIQARAMGIPRTEAKSVDYGILYGAQWAKIKKMTGKSTADSKQLVEDFWNGSRPLKELRDNLTKYWESKDKKFILGVDGRKIMVRSKHALLNSLFQSAGVIYAKYVSVLLMQKLEKHGVCIDPFKGRPDVCSMIEYHDEQDLYCNPEIFEFKVFDDEGSAKEFVSNWDSEQLSAIGEGKNGKYFVTLPNIVSKNIQKSMFEVEQKLKIKVEMGFEYMLGNNWFQCH